MILGRKTSGPHVGIYIVTECTVPLTHRRLRAATGAARRCASALAITAFAVLPMGAFARTPITPVQLDRFDAQKTKVALSDGEELAYIDAGARDAPPLVLIHGYTDSARDWAPIAPLLASRFRLIIVDLRGHGASSKPDCCYTRFDFAYDIKLLLESLSIGSAHFAGHSLGSIVAQTYAELWPESTRRLILISSSGTSFGPEEPPGSAKPLAQSWLAPLATLEDPIDPDSAFMHDWWKVSMSINPEFFSRKQREDAAAIPAHVWRTMADQTLLGVDLRWMLPRIRAPTLLIWGGKDTLMSETGRAVLRTRIARAETRVFPSLGHDLLWEDPEAVAGIMISFLAKQ
jgi:pimeloyl-ACP methyl ester carboxylesterase